MKRKAYVFYLTIGLPPETADFKLDRLNWMPLLRQPVIDSLWGPKQAGVLGLCHGTQSVTETRELGLCTRTVHETNLICLNYEIIKKREFFVVVEYCCLSEHNVYESVPHSLIVFV